MITKVKFEKVEFEAPKGNHSFVSKKLTDRAMNKVFIKTKCFSYRLKKYLEAFKIPSKIRIIPIQVTEKTLVMIPKTIKAIKTYTLTLSPHSLYCR